MMKHSVIVVTYNQEKLLPLALDSLFDQSVLPYEVLIGDDCSTDRTWDVVTKYYEKYPHIIKPIRNEKNSGISANINSLLPLPTGDIVSFLSGDDLYKPGIFETFSKEVEKNKLNPKTDKFILMCNSVNLYPNGKETVYSNYRFRNKNLFKLKIRYALNFRETGFSSALFKTISPIREDIGYHADWLFSIDQIVKCDEFIFINESFPVYRIGTGIVSRTKTEELTKSRLLVIDEIIKTYYEKLDESDISYLNYEKAYHNYVLKKTSSSLKRLVSHYVTNINNFATLSKNFSTGINLLRLIFRHFSNKK